MSSSDLPPASGPARAEAAPAVELIACPVCDLLQRQADPPVNGRVSCARCGEVLMTNRRGALERTLVASISSVILMVAAIVFPFLELSVAGLSSSASVLEVALAFRGTIVAALSIATLLLIVVIPLIRAAALTYTLLPLILGRRPAPRAERAFRLARELKPWAMAEVFVVGVAVALVKIAGMASISLGPAFWALAGVVVLVISEGASLCEWTVWREIERARKAPPAGTRRVAA
ncbi:paraquat-inducible protein A [Amaricoccus solimangrovi]|uniref:Paraquat-inducible protein A n=1 Tax=Amaricoccus solimangrovi TaxID=2589815 RepID=A0A501WHM2_9RHOB|nr:paraquat-inducible protein A [Amaricoccus solimangrovi]TPE46587.1 paraquat-inducible protein A [Amaricoccus solimangrovi]